MIVLTDEQRQELAESGPTRIRDPHTNETYVLVREELYGKLQTFLGDNFAPHDAYPAIDAAFREEWDDPKMAEYDPYEEHRP